MKKIEINKNKFKLHNHKLDFNKIELMINNNKNIKEIANTLDIPVRIMGEIIRYYDIEVKNKRLIHDTNTSFFNDIDSEIKAYLLGYLLADGCISIEPKKKNGEIYSYSKRIAFTVSEDDGSVLQLFVDHISPKAKITVTHNKKGAVNRKPSHKLRISSVELVTVLIDKYGIKPRKTYDYDFKFNFDLIPDMLHRHFIRGFFDGDGGISKHKTAKTRTMNLVFNSKHFMDQIIDILKTIIPDFKYSFIREESDTAIWYKVSASLGNGKEKFLYDYLYKDSNYYLNRKKIKFNEENIVLNGEINKSSSM